MLGSNDINHNSNSDIRSAIIEFLKDEGCREYNLAQSDTRYLPDYLMDMFKLPIKNYESSKSLLNSSIKEI